MSESIDDSHQSYRDEEDEALSRAICKAAIDKGLDPNDFGVTPEAEIVVRAKPIKLTYDTARTQLMHISRRDMISTLARANEEYELERQRVEKVDITVRPLLAFSSALMVGGLFGLTAPVTIITFFGAYALLCVPMGKKD